MAWQEVAAALAKPPGVLLDLLDPVSSLPHAAPRLRVAGDKATPELSELPRLLASSHRPTSTCASSTPPTRAREPPLLYLASS